MYAFLAVCAVVCRCVLVWQGSGDWLAKRVEISTPVNSWSRIQEGVALLASNYSPYSGDIFHEQPLVLSLFQSLTGLGEWAVAAFFISVDVAIALCLAGIASLHMKEQLQRQARESAGYGKGVADILVKADPSLPAFVAIVYLLQPYSILSCAGHSTLSLTTLSISLALYLQLRGMEVLSALALAVGVYLSLYPAMLLCPLIIIAYKRGGVVGCVVYAAVTVAWTGLLFYASYHMTGSWNYLYSTYGVILTVPDLTPNIGLFWYFFTEAFEHFRVFFLCVFQINAFIYVLPLSVRLSDHPVFLAYVLLSLMALFKSYPSVGDLVLPLSLLPLWSHTFRYLRYTLVVLCMFLIASVLCPVLWYLWIHAGSANANFFFAITLTYALAQVFLVSDVMYSFLVYRYDLCHGLPRVDSTGDTIALVLR